MAWPRFGSRRPPAGRSHARPGTALRPAYPEESSSAAAQPPATGCRRAPPGWGGGAPEDLQRVFDDQADFVEVRLEAVGAHRGLAHAERQVLGRAALHHVLDLHVAFPAALVGQRVAVGVGAHVDAVGIRIIGVPALAIAGHEAQPRHAEGGHVEVVAEHQRAFLGRVEVAVLDRVVQVDGVGLAQVVEVVVAVVALVRQQHLVRAVGEAAAHAQMSLSSSPITCLPWSLTL